MQIRREMSPHGLLNVVIVAKSCFTLRPITTPFFGLRPRVFNRLVDNRLTISYLQVNFLHY